MTSVIAAATSTKTTSTATTSALHVRALTLDTRRVAHHDGFDGETGSNRLMNLVQDRRYQVFDEDDEFVSVEQVENTYFIKTSPYPFRPARGIYRSDRTREARKTDNRIALKENRERRDSARTDQITKFTYFLNPSFRTDLINYKMSRKDKKHSETYYERIKRKQKYLESSISTITTASYRRKSMGDAKIVNALSYTTNNPVDESTKRKISRFASTKKDSILLQKIREKSKRKKRLAPKPSTKEQICTSFNENTIENEKTNSKKENETLSSEVRLQGNKSDVSQILCEKNDKDGRDSKSERDRSVIACSQSSLKQDYYDRNDKYFNEKKNASKTVNEEQGNKMRGGFKGIFPKNHHVEDKDEADDMICRQIDKFNQQLNEGLKKDERKSELLEFNYSTSESRYRGSLLNEKWLLHEENSLKEMKPDTFLTILNREAVTSSNLDNIKNGNRNTIKMSSLKDESRKAERKNKYPHNLNHEDKFRTVGQLTHDENRLNQKEIEIGSKAEMPNINTKRKKQAFKSFSSSNCNNLSFNSQEPVTLAANVSFLYTSQKTRSLT